MKSGTMRLCAFAGQVAVTLLFIGMWPLMNIIPPLAPSTPTAEVAAFYRDNATGMIVGGIFVMGSSVLIFPFMAGLATFLKKIEGPVSPWTYSLLMVASYGFVTLFLCGLMFTAAAYRPGFSDETIHIISDLAFFLLVIPAIPGCIQNMIIGIAVLGDKRAQPVFPRWVGYVNVWTGVLSLPGCVVALFKVGPFAWNGVLAFWLPAIVFGIWINVNFWAMLNAIKRDALAAD